MGISHKAAPPLLLLLQVPVFGWICVGPFPLRGTLQPWRTPGIWHWSREKHTDTIYSYSGKPPGLSVWLLCSTNREKRTCFCTCQTNLEDLPVSLQRSACLFLRSHRRSLFSTPSSPPASQCCVPAQGRGGWAAASDRNSFSRAVPPLGINAKISHAGSEPAEAGHASLTHTGHHFATFHLLILCAPSRE